MSNFLVSRYGVLACGVLFAASAAAGGTRFDCGKVEAGSIEALVCQDSNLASLDRRMAEVYAAAAKKAANEHPPVLRAEQRGWIKGRNECWKSGDTRQCVADSYRLRIAELQARYRLVAPSPAVFYACDGNPANELAATFFDTDPPTLIAERGDSVSFMVLQPSGSGAKYQGRNETFWEHQGEVMIRWGVDAPEMRCVKKSAPAGSAVPLSGTAWRLRAIQSMDDAQGTTTVADPERYTVTFGADGKASFRLDCNRGSGSWQSMASGSDSGSLEFGMVATTRAMCPPGSLDQKHMRQLPYVRSYLFKDGKLFMSLMADGGILEWEKIP